MAESCNESPDTHLNMRVWGLKPSPTIAINEISHQLQERGRQVYSFGLGQSPFPVPRLVGEALQRHAFEKDYLPVRGLPTLRETVADHHRQTFGIKCSSDDVLIGPGSKELMFLLQLVYYGEIVIPTPAWVSYAPQARIIGRQITLLETEASHGWRVTPDQLAALCKVDPRRPRLLVLNYPSNPTGSTYSADELQELAAVAKRYRVVLLSDEIYGKLHHDGSHSSIVPFYPEGTVFSGGLSKWCGAGGWRLGLFVVPACMRWLLDAMAAVASETFTSTCAPVQYAAIEAFAGGTEIDEYVGGCRRILKALGQRLAGLLDEAGAHVLEPEGGFYLFPDFCTFAEPLRRGGIETSQQFCDRLLNETGVALLPGSHFGRPADELTARLAYVDFDGARALEAAANLEGDTALEDDFLDEHCGPTMRGVRALCDWLQEKGSTASGR